MKLKVAHISDLHIGISETHDQFILRQLGKISAACVDHLIITGDLTHSGTEREFRKTLQILSRCGFLSSRRLTVIPGNHDLFSFFFTVFHDIGDFRRKLHRVPKAIREIYQYNWTNYQLDLSSFNRYFDFAFRDAVLFNKFNGSGYPFIKLLHDKVALIGLESNRLLPHFRSNTICSNGYIDPVETASILAHEILSNKTKVVLLHHHLSPEKDVLQNASRWVAASIKLRNRVEILEIFQQFNVDLVLHGHYHIHENYRLSDTQCCVINNGDNRRGSLVQVFDEDFEITAIC